MGCYQTLLPYISVGNCNSELIFGMRASFRILYKNMTSYRIISKNSFRDVITLYHVQAKQATNAILHKTKIYLPLVSGPVFFPALNLIRNSRNSFTFIANCHNYMYENHYNHAFTSFLLKNSLLIQTILLDSEEFLVHFAPSCKQLLAKLESLVAVVRNSGNNNETKHIKRRDELNTQTR